ncbi:MAG: hypothetical protein ACP5OV_07470 [Acidimicrobiales bacterium]
MAAPAPPDPFAEPSPTPALRRDPLTGCWSFHPDLAHKPFTFARRHLPEPGGPCVFCALAAQPVDAGGNIANGDETSHLAANGEHAFALENRWRPFEAASGAQLVIARRHATALEDLTVPELAEFLTLLVHLGSRQARRFARTLCFVNIGLEVNGTQPHLHGQIVSTDLTVDSPWTATFPPASLDEDVSQAREADLVVVDEATALVYCPWAPTASGEVRILAPDVTALAAALHGALWRLRAVLGAFPYNLLVRDTPSLLAQVVPRLSAVGVLPDYFGLTVVTLPPNEIARDLREAADSAPDPSP